MVSCTEHDSSIRVLVLFPSDPCQARVRQLDDEEGVFSETERFLCLEFGLFRSFKLKYAKTIHSFILFTLSFAMI